MSVKVSVICLVYNHEKFLERCLEGLVHQNTNFDYEIIVHDDCSTDSSRKIIETYVEKYPELLVPQYEEQNQYSQGKEFVQSKMQTKAQGIYFAFCEGDDYWCDNNKLQIQYDYMEQHPECSMCVHNTIRHDLMGDLEDSLFNDWTSEHVLSEKDVFFGWNVQTTSYFIRREVAWRPDFALPVWCGDYTWLTLAFDRGNIVSLPNVMSVYNYNNTNGLTYLNDKIDYRVKQKKELIRAEYLKKYNQYTKYKYDNTIQSRINQIHFDNKLLEVKCAYENHDSISFRQRLNQLVKLPFYQELKKEGTLLQQCKRYLKYNLFFSYYLWVLRDKIR